MAGLIVLFAFAGAFDEEDEVLMNSLAQSAGEILRKAQVHEALMHEQRKTRALVSVLQAQEVTYSPAVRPPLCLGVWGVWCVCGQHALHLR